MKNPNSRPPFWKSIAWRIQVWYALALALAISGMMVAFQKYERENRLDALDGQLAHLLRPMLPEVSRKLGPPRRGNRPPPDGEHRGKRPPRAPHREHPGWKEGDAPPRRKVESWLEGEYWVVVWREDGTIAFTEGREPPAHASYNEGHIPDEFTLSNGHRKMRVRGPARSVLEVGAPLTVLNEGLTRHAWYLAGIGFCLYTAGVFFGWIIVRWGLHPVVKIGDSAREIAAGDLSRRIDVSASGNELRVLAETLNGAFARIQLDNERREHFAADASHELRTPLTVILGQIQRLLSRDLPASESKESLLVAERAAKRMRTLVEELMLLARIDNDAPMEVEQLDLAGIARTVASDLRGLVAKRDATLDLKLESVPLSGNRDNLLRVFTNLLANALQHSPIGVKIAVRTWIENGHACASVTDNGLGVPEDRLPLLFERFYRGDSSRNREPASSNSGLGLAICKAIVEKHGGRTEASNGANGGAVFTLRIPV